MNKTEKIKRLKSRLDAKGYQYAHNQLKMIIDTLDEVVNEKIVYPFDSERFLDMWSKWVQYKRLQFKFEYKSILTLQASLNSLHELSNGVESIAIKIMLQSIANGWRGFFELKNNNNGNNQAGGSRISEDYKRTITEELFD